MSTSGAKDTSRPLNAFARMIVTSQRISSLSSAVRSIKESHLLIRFATWEP